MILNIIDKFIAIYLYKTRLIKIFLRDPLKYFGDPPGGRDPQFEEPCFIVWEFIIKPFGR